MIKTGAWGPHHHGLLAGDDRLRLGMLAFLGLGRSEGEVEGDGTGEVMLTCCRKRRSKRGPVVETGKVERVVGEVEVQKDPGGGNAFEKACVDCGSTKTPLWRGGPAGPKTLCNACGIRCRKMRRKGSKEATTSTSTSSSSSSSSNSDVVKVEEEELRQRQRRKQEGLWLLLQQSRKFRYMCGEEEAEAAVLLMALSTGLFLH